MESQKCHLTGSVKTAHPVALASYNGREGQHKAWNKQTFKGDIFETPFMYDQDQIRRIFNTATPIS